MLKIGATTVKRVIGWSILFVMLSAIFTEIQLTTTLKILKNLWCIIRSLLLSKCSILPVHLTVDDKNYHNYYDIANFFLMRTSLISLPLFSQTTFLTYPTGTVVQIMLIPSCHLEYPTVSPISETFVRTSLKKPSTGKATGLDELGGYFLKTAASSIS